MSKLPDCSDWYARKRRGRTKNTRSHSRPGASSRYGVSCRFRWRKPKVRYPEIRFCQAVRYFSLLSAFESKILTFASISFVGKMSGLLATDGSYVFAAAPAPVTGGM